MTDNLEHEFFTKVKGWDFVPTRGHPWHSPGGGRYFELPPISTSWDAFHKWVVPELMGKANGDADEVRSINLSEPRALYGAYLETHIEEG